MLSLLWSMREKVDYFCLNVELRFVHPIMACVLDYHLIHSLKAVVNKNHHTNNMLQALKYISTCSHYALFGRSYQVVSSHILTSV